MKARLAVSDSPTAIISVSTGLHRSFSISDLCEFASKICAKLLAVQQLHHVTVLYRRVTTVPMFRRFRGLSETA